MGEPVLTIYVPTYERPDFLRECLSSLLGQTRKDFVVHVLDNASSSDYGFVADHPDPRVRYERRAVNVGASRNIEDALAREADTDYVMVFHDDDVLDPHYVESALSVLDAAPRLGFVAALAGTSHDQNIWTPLTFERPSDLALALLAGLPVPFSSVIYRASLLARIRPDISRFGMVFDRPLLLTAATHSPVAVIPQPMVRYRIHDAQDSKTGQLTDEHLRQLFLAYRETLGSRPARKELTTLHRALSAEAIASYRRTQHSLSLWSFLRRLRADDTISWIGLVAHLLDVVARRLRQGR